LISVTVSPPVNIPGPSLEIVNMIKNPLSLPVLFCMLLPMQIAAASPPLDNLQKMMPGVKFSVPQETPVKDLYLVKIGGRYVYISADGEHALIGNLIDIKNGVNLTEKGQARDNIPLIKSFPEKDMIIFSAIGKEKDSITVFSDTSCPYCKKLHKEVAVLQQAGISVRYIPFPRGLQRGGGYKQMKSVWCADDRQSAMDIANRVSKGKLESKECAVDDVLKAGYALGNELGVSGTPTIFLSDGTRLGGYVPAMKIIEMLFSANK
jgi:thiol:disulfide interchange protein DsbC